MTAISSNGTGGGNWGATTTWNGGVVPIDGDDVTIVSGDEVLFVNSDDTVGIDQSGFSTGIRLTVTGTLRFSTGANRTSYLKISDVANLDGTGNIYIGNSASDLVPQSSILTIYLNGRDITTTGRYFYGGAHGTGANHAKLTQGFANDMSEVQVDADLDLHIGDTVLICNGNVNGSSVDSLTPKGVYTVTSYTWDTDHAHIGISPNLSGARNAGDYVAYRSGYHRPVNIIKNGSAGMWTVCSSTTVEGIFSYNAGSYEVANNGTQQYCTFDTASGGGWYYRYTSGLTLKYMTFIRIGWTLLNSGLNVLYRCIAAATSNMHSGGQMNTFVECIAQNTDNGFTYNGSGNSAECTYKSCVSKNGANRDLVSTFNVLLDGCYIHAAVNSPSAYGAPYALNESFNHNGVAGAYYCWTAGGYGVRQSTYQHAGRDTLKLACASASLPVYRDYWLPVKGGERMTISVDCSKDFADTDKAKIQLIDPTLDPLRMLTASALAEAYNNSASNDPASWMTLTVNYTPATSGFIIARVWAMMIGCNAYFDTRPLDEMLPAKVSRRPVILF